MKLPEASAETICSPVSDTMVTLAAAAVLPEIVTVSLVTNDSSSGDVTVSVTVTGDDGVGETAEVGAGVVSTCGVGDGWVS